MARVEVMTVMMMSWVSTEGVVSILVGTAKAHLIHKTAFTAFTYHGPLML
jgi:hypothetical protein